MGGKEASHRVCCTMCAHRLFVTHSSIVTRAHHTVAPKSTNIRRRGSKKTITPPALPYTTSRRGNQPSRP
ncbi:unnamed protein product [Ectocarpus sp. 8 AP-2014]